MKKMLFILNPISGQKRAAKHLADIVSLYNRAGYEVTVYVTGEQGDATRMAEEKCNEVDLIVCCGGDGTYNETITGLQRAGSKVPVGYIPAGSTNDLATSLALSGNVMQAARDVLEGEPVAYDIGKFQDRYFSYVASFGAFTAVSYNTPQYIKNALGHTAYLLGSIQELSQIRKEHIRMVLDEERIVEDDFLFGAICNATSVGGVLTLDPNQVDMSDGLLEVLLVRAPKNLTELTECIQAVQSQNYGNCAMITFLSARKMEVFTNPDMVWTLDGEREDGHAHIHVENQHLAVNLMRRVR